ncbi:hypothetical protein BGZ65_003027 [Modicella reniformis]|uniref:RRM domain-containing protein n=1 Tax=Modicella reniformis TaxID=1440133 RepID=A0A9P6J038_9FUNG|nr:hypothetical protein BGZ65_003027 [Modicella reniformis]
MAAATLNIIGNSHFAASQDYSSVKGVNILSSSLNTGRGSISGPFDISDYFSSSIPKSSLHNATTPTGNNNNNSGNSIHIGSLTSGLSGLSLLRSLSYNGNGIGSATTNNGFPYNNSNNNISSSSINTTNNNNNNNNSSNTNASSTNTASSSGVSNGNGNGTGNFSQQEEISTIFVVGFPDDMQEREFQNMFVFTPGFEAATLKIPNKDQQEDDALTLGVNGVNPRKQIIGFAKFRTHQEALQAITVLNGRRVDAEKGSLLKAEMAKKNLHTRRGLSNDQVATPGVNTAAALPPTPIGINSNNVGINNSKLPHPLQHRNSLAGSAAYDAFHSVPCSPALPSDLLSTNEYPSSYDFYADVYAPNGASSLGFTESFNGRHQNSLQQQQQQQSDLSSSFLGRQTTFDVTRVDPLSMGSLSNNTTGGLAGSIAGSFSNSMSSSFNNSRPIGLPNNQRFNKSFLDLDNDTPTTTGFLSKSIPVKTEHGFKSALFNNEDLPNPRFQGLPINTNAAAALASASVPSPSIGSPGFRPPINPGDQNPPCNTLYVGNLPMNTSEDELRALFSRCVGYRRLCFRTKANGPMCFVEFENIECATQVLNDLYGNPLSNSVKGGIRLSYSKNPLGVRNSTPSQPSGLGNQLHMNGASFLERRDSMSAIFEHYQ